MLEPKKVHEAILQHLLTKEIFFKPRMVNRDNRLLEYYWFQGTEDYMNVSFWEGNDSDRKIHNIGFHLDFYDGKCNAYLLLTARRDEDKAIFLSRIAEETQSSLNNRSNEWIKEYGEINDFGNLLETIDNFLVLDKVKIDEMIESNKDSQIKFIASNDFESYIEKINSYRNLDEKIDFHRANKIIEPKTKRILRKGVTQKNVETYFREQLKKKIEVTQIHNQFQEKLFEELKNRYPNDVIEMENNFFDIIHESSTDETITIFEVKPYESVSKCIREGIGQLLLYSQQKSLSISDSKKIKIVIAGQNKANDEDLEFIRYLKKNLNLEFEYLQIK